MYQNRELSEDHFVKHVFSDDFIILIAESESDYSVKKLLGSLNGNLRIIRLNYNVRKTDDVFIDSFSVNTNFDCVLRSDKRLPIKELFSVVETINKLSKKIILDISVMHLRFLGSMISIIHHYKWESVIIAYAEPGSYPRENKASSEYKNRIADFDLYSSFLGYGQIPFLASVDQDGKNSTWVVFLGFEGKRSAAVYGEIGDSCERVIPVITFPSIKPGWSNYTFDANQHLLDVTQSSASAIRYVDALDPYATVNFIEHNRVEHPNDTLIISPFSSRPISLGVFLYAINDERCDIYYDTPEMAHSNVRNDGSIHYYDVLDFFKSN